MIIVEESRLRCNLQQSRSVKINPVEALENFSVGASELEIISSDQRSFSSHSALHIT